MQNASKWRNGGHGTNANDKRPACPPRSQQRSEDGMGSLASICSDDDSQADGCHGGYHKNGIVIRTIMTAAEARELDWASERKKC